jgi:hypothetical protein
MSNLESAAYNVIQSYDKWRISDADLPPDFHKQVDELREALISRMERLSVVASSKVKK